MTEKLKQQNADVVITVGRAVYDEKLLVAKKVDFLHYVCSLFTEHTNYSQK